MIKLLTFLLTFAAGGFFMDALHHHPGRPYHSLTDIGFAIVALLLVFLLDRPIPKPKEKK